MFGTSPSVFVKLKVDRPTVIRFDAMKRLVLALLLFVAACSSPPPEDATGEQIFRQICATCHSADLSGGVGPPLGPGSNVASQPDEFLRITITNGRGRMPSFSNTLSQQQIDSVIAYVRQVQGG